MVAPSTCRQWKEHQKSGSWETEQVTASLQVFQKQSVAQVRRRMITGGSTGAITSGLSAFACKRAADRRSMFPSSKVRIPYSTE